MNYSANSTRYIGRVGGLAVALGVGAGIAIAAASVASADTGSPSDTSATAGKSAHDGAQGSSRARARVTSQAGAGTPTAAQKASRSNSPLIGKSGHRAIVRNAPTEAAAVGDDQQQPQLADGQSVNLLQNPGAEFGDPSLTGYSSVTVPGWTVTGTPTVIRYGTVRRFPSATGSPGPLIAPVGFPIFGNDSLKTPADSGKQFFGGGPVADSSISQNVDLSAAQAAIDLGGLTYNLGASLGGAFIDPSQAKVQVTFLNGDGNSLGTGSLQTVTMWNRRFITGFIERTTSGTIPVGTRSAQVTVSFDDKNPILGNYNNAYADNISFTIGTAMDDPGDPTPPVSTVGELDHVFLVYMENKGYTNIVGSPNAPVINTYLNTYGQASQMYALTHPSTPNYSAVVGGSDFNINYDCDENCVDAPNLSNTIADAGKTWAAYEQNGGGYTNAGELGFLTFSNIYNNSELVNANIRPLTQMATDLQSSATTPNFVWWAADEDNNMEGPVDNLRGVISFALSQLTNQQYNVKAGDNFIGETIPTIMSSNTWNDPNVKSAIFLTFDEDNNNLSLGFDNQGNHIVMIVIPSPGAVAAGMKSGNFSVAERYDHYSMMRTIEESLGLASLTQNDRYAVPMNGFWETPTP